MLTHILQKYKIYNLNKDIYNYNIMDITTFLHNNDYSSYRLDIKNMKDTLLSFKKKLDIFKSYDGTTKLWIDDNDILINDNSYYAQRIIRWWYVQNRDKICNYLEEIFNHYKLFIQMINIGLNQPCFKPQVLEIHNENVKFLLNIKCNILHLLTIYSSHAKIKIVINSFDNTIERYINQHN